MEFATSVLFEIGGFGVSLGILLMVLGGLIAVIGVLLAINHAGFGKMIAGVFLAVLGLAFLGVGYTLDQMVEVEYTVSDVTDVSVRDTNRVYRVTLKADGGVDTIVYVNDAQIFRFNKGETVSMQKKEVKALRDQNAAMGE